MKLEFVFKRTLSELYCHNTREMIIGKRRENHDNSSETTNHETVSPGIVNFLKSLFAASAEFEEASM